MTKPTERAATDAVIENVRGRALPVRGDDIDTDRIIPARFLRCVTFEGIGEHAFEDDRAQLAGRHPFDQAPFQGASVLVVNRNFGCGSSREHAPQSLMRWGIQGIVGVSFAEIFFGNCVALGLPCVTCAGKDVAAIQSAVEADPGIEVTIDLVNGRVRVGARELEAAIPPGARQSFLSGTWDAAAMLLRDPHEVDAVATRLPYVSGFERP